MYEVSSGVHISISRADPLVGTLNTVRWHVKKRHQVVSTITGQAAIGGRREERCPEDNSKGGKPDWKVKKAQSWNF
jgi:hypothetical protein